MALPSRSHDVLSGVIVLLMCLILIFAARDSATSASAYPLGCRYVHNELDLHRDCARRDGAVVRIAPVHTTRMRFRRGLAEVAVDEIGWLWVRRDGRALPVFFFDNGSDPYVQGLVRGWHGGKAAFYDRRLRLALATPYDWSYPFNRRGAALVCMGCRSDGRSPSSMIGGRWALINRKGALLEPLSDNDTASDRYFAR